MQKVPQDNETGMKLYPPESVKILVDNDYIMASLGVLSKTHRQGAIRLLAKSLRMELKENEHVANKAAFIEELQRMAAARKAKEEEQQKHIEEMEAMGYDLTDYKEALAEKIGGATKEEVEAAKKEAMLNDRTVKKGADLVEHAEEAVSSTKPADDYDPAQHVMRACGEVDGKPNCNHECWACTRTHCPYRDKNAKRP